MLPGIILGMKRTLLAAVLGVAAVRSQDLPRLVRLLGAGLGSLVVLQGALGVVTLMAGAPVLLGIAHQLAAALLLGVAVVFAWRVRRI